MVITTIFWVMATCPVLDARPGSKDKHRPRPSTESSELEDGNFACAERRRLWKALPSLGMLLCDAECSSFLFVYYVLLI